MNIEELKVNFTNYAEQYLKVEDKNSDDYKNLLRKYNHSFRVMDLAYRIARSLDMSGSILDFIRVCGLVHDIGRFEQWKQYHTFVDSKSVDHASFSVDILKKENFFKGIINDGELKSIAYRAVKYHNKFKVPNNFNKETKQICNIIRDADKIDLINILAREERVVNIGEDAFSELIMNTLLNKKQILLTDRTTKADFLASSFAFIFDINYKETFKILKERDYYNKIVDIYKNKTTNEELKEQLEIVRRLINQEIEDNIN